MRSLLRNALVLFAGIAILAATAKAQAPEPPAATNSSPETTGQAKTATPQASTAETRATFQRGMELYQHSQFHAAATVFQAVAQDGGENAGPAYAWLARCDLQNSRAAAARTAAEQGLALAPNALTVHSAMGEVLFREGRLNEAEDVYRKILLEHPGGDARAMLGLARIYAATANYKTAEQLVVRAHQLTPDDPDLYWRWVRTLNAKDRLAALRAHPLEEDLVREASQKEWGVHPSWLNVLEDQEKHPERTCKLKNPGQPGQIKLENLLEDINRLRGFGIVVRLNDSASGKLLLDTGAYGITINSRIAQKAGVEKIFENSVGGIGDRGASKGYLGYAKTMRIGDFEFENCYIDVVEKKGSLGEDGLIGMDVFEDFLVELKFAQRKVVLSPLPPFPDEPAKAPGLESSETAPRVAHNRYIPPQYSKFEKFYRMGHDILLPTQVNAVPNKLFLVDTGAWDNTIGYATAREATKLRRDSNIHVKGLSGEVKDVYTTDEVTLSFGSFRQKRKDLVAFDLTKISDDSGIEVSGTLGFAMLWMLDMKIDYRDHLIEFEYNLPH